MRPFIAILAITVALICLAMAQTFDFVPNKPCTDNSNAAANTAFVHNCSSGGGGGVNSVFGRVGTVTAQTGDYSFSQVSGTVGAVQLPFPSASTLGGVESGTAPSNQFMTGITTLGVPTFAQPSFTNLSGTASNAQIPVPTASALGGIESITCGAGQFLNVINSSGVPSCATPSGGGGTPGGSNGQVQFNNSGAFGGLTNTQLTADINVFTSTLSGAVPASGGSSTSLFLAQNGTFQTPAGGGNVSTSGTITTGNCAQWASATTIQSTSSPCGSGGGGTNLGYVSIASFGAVGDGSCHPLSGIYGSLPAAQAVYPFVSDLNQCVDWAATQQAINNAFLPSAGSSPVFCPAGNFQLSNPIFFDSANNSQGSAAAWAAGTTYGNAATVTYNGIPWQSLGSGNVGNAPTSVHGKPGNISVISVSGTPTGSPLVEVAISNASPAVVTYSSPGFVGVVAGQGIVFSTQTYNVQPGNTTPVLPTGINPNQVYYVLSTGLTTSQFEFSATPGGAAVNTSSAGTGNFFVNGQVWAVTPQSSSNFSNRISFIGQEGLAGPAGCQFTNLAPNTGTIYLGPQNGNLIKDINLTYGFSFAFSRCNVPNQAFGWVAVDNNGGPSKTVYENIGAENFYANWVSGVPSLVLGDTNTFIKPAFRNGCFGMSYISTQSFINTIIDGIITNNITGIYGSLVDGIKVLGGNYSTLCQNLSPPTYCNDSATSFAVTGQTSTTGCGPVNVCISMTITSPDSNLTSSACGQYAGAALNEGVTWPAEWPFGNSCGYSVFMVKTTSHGIVPMYIVNFNLFTNVATFGIPRDSFGIYENTCCADLTSDILAQSTIYASAVSTPFFGNLQVEQIHIENDGMPLQIMCHCIGEFGGGRGAEIKSVKLNAAVAAGNSVCCNQTPTGARAAIFYATQVVPFINNTGIGGMTVQDIEGGDDSSAQLTQDPVLIAQGFSSLDWHHIVGRVYGSQPSYNLIGAQIGFPDFVTGGPSNGQLSGNYLISTGGSAFGTGNFDNPLMFMSPAMVFATFVYGTQFLSDQWRGFMWGQAPTIGVRPSPLVNSCILPAQATTLQGALPAITHTSTLQNFLPIINGGTSGTYAVNDVLTVSGGTGTAATLTVTAVSAGKITGISITTSGSYSTPPLGTTLSVTGGGGTGATFGPPIWNVGYTVAYPTLFGGQSYRICSFNGTGLNTGPGTKYSLLSTNQAYSYFQNLTTTNVPNLAWTMTGQSPFVYMNQEALALMYPGLQIALTPTGGGASCTGNTWTAIVLENHPTLGYIKTVGASADGSGYVPNFGAGLTCTGTTIVQQAPNLVNPSPF